MGFRADAYYGWGEALLGLERLGEAKEKFRKAKELGYSVPERFLLEGGEGPGETAGRLK